MNCQTLPSRAQRLLGIFLLTSAFGVQAQTPLADQPPFTTTTPAGNLALPLSVEYPTAVSVANIAAYTTARRFLGYFDPGKCYSYNYSATEANRYFFPSATTSNNVCSGGRWSGSFLNWATMQTIDPFRKVLTGGLRTTDEPAVTIIEKAWASGQGGTGNFPNRTLTAGVAGATPFAWGQFRMRIQGLGNRMRFTGTGSVDAAPTAYDPGAAPVNQATTYEVSIRVRVCDPTAPGGVEINCVQYGANYKPQGLIQEYSDRIRYSVFGYLNDSSVTRDGGVLRARQKFVGPMEPRPGLPAAVNAVREWDPETGVFLINPDTADATATGVTNSGVINYLNKFGQSGSYKTLDPVSELYYAAVRYFKNLGNVPQWSDVSGAANAAQRTQWIDGFPVITAWDDPIQYACQRNFILGIGDVNTHNDKNVPGATSGNSEPRKPGAVTADTTVDAVADTNRIGALEGLGAIGSSASYSGRNNSAYIAGLAYDAHTRDIRPDNAGVAQTVGQQTITTYWLDVLEFQTYVSRNQYWLATKYGGFRVPEEGYNPNTAAAAPAASLWNSGGATAPNGVDLKPDNYFTATAPEDVEAGLRTAFASIAANLRAYTTSFSIAAPQLNTTNNVSFSALYDARNWTGDVELNTLSVEPPNYTPVRGLQWRASQRLAAQLAGTGWDSNRRVISYNGDAGVAFRASGASTITAAQLATLDTNFVAADDRTQYLNYLRGDRSNELGQTGALGYRARASLLGDIVDSRLTVLAAPVSSYLNAYNPGYEEFKAGRLARAPVAYVGANDGMLHAFDASNGATGGRELFAYVPSALFNGPSTPATPNVDGLAMLGNPNYVHRYYVNATPEVFDVDMARAGQRVTGNPTPNWRSILVGGLGKGGRSYYAIDVTDPPTAAETETQLARRVLWEFPNARTPALERSRFGFSYGEPKLTKTVKWGWVAVFASGYNNVDGGGYIFFVDPRDGTWLETVATGVGTPTVQSGLAHVQAATREFADNTAESLYAGDLLGNVWRVDVRQATGAYQSPTNPQLIARATAEDNTAQPITTRVRVAEHVNTRRRYVMFGTGRLLDASDLGNTQQQTFYVIEDGTAQRFNTPASLPPTVNFPITRANLVNQTDLTVPFTPDPARQMGWFVELGRNPALIGWRNILEAEVFVGDGVLAFGSVVPGGGACSPTGNSRLYAIDFANGRSVLTETRTAGGATTRTRIAYSTNIQGLVTDLRFVNIRGERRLIGAGSEGSPRDQELEPMAPPGLRRLNWRELPAPQ